MGLRDAEKRIEDQIARAREGDRRALKNLMFPFHYGVKRDEETGEWRPHTPEEIEHARKVILGE